MPDKISPEAFAAKIKAKYPQYKDVENTKLVNRIIEKYPEYAKSVDFGEKKNDGSKQTPNSLSELNGGGEISENGSNLFQTPANTDIPTVLTETGEQIYSTEPTPVIEESNGNLGLRVKSSGLGSSLTSPGGFQSDITNEITNKRTPSEQSLDGALNAYTSAQGDDASNEILNASNNRTQEIVGIDTENVGNRPGYIYNKLLQGVGSLASGLVDIGLNAAKGNPAMMGIGNDAMIGAYRKEVAPIVRDYLKEKIGTGADKGSEAQYNNEFITSALGGLAQSAPAMLTGYTGLLVQGYDFGMQAVQNADPGGLLDEETKTIYATGLGIVTSALERYGLQKVLKGNTTALSSILFNKALKEAKSKGGGKVTGDLLEDYINKNVQGIAGKFALGGARATEAFLVESVTGASQEVAAIASEDLLNKATGKSIFDTSKEDTWEGFLGRVAYAGAQEGVGGFVMGAGIQVLDGARRKLIKKNQTQLETIEDQLDNPNLSEPAQEILTQRKIELQAKLETDIAEETEEQKKLPAATIKRSQEISADIEKAETALTDPNLSDDLKPEIESKVKELEKELAEAVKDGKKETHAPAIKKNDLVTYTDAEGNMSQVPVESVNGDTAVIGVNKDGIYEKVEVPVSELAVIGEQLPVNEPTTEIEKDGNVTQEIVSEPITDAPAPIDTPVQENVLSEPIESEIPKADTEKVDETIKDSLTEKESQYKESTPDELAGQYYDEVTTPTNLSAKELVISDGFKIKQSSYTEWGDRNNITNAKARSYFSNKGSSADVIAHSINNKHFDGNEVVSPQDIIDFIDRFPNGADSAKRPSSNPKLKEINGAYFEKTGKKLNRATAKKYAEIAARLRSEPDIDKELTDIIEGENLTLENLRSEQVQNVIDFLKPEEISLADATKFIEDYLNKNGKGTTTIETEEKTGERDSGNDATGGSIRSGGRRGTDNGEQTGDAQREPQTGSTGTGGTNEAAVGLRESIEAATGERKGSSREQIDDAEKRAALDYAKKNNLWIDNLATLGSENLTGGNENTLVLDLGTQTVFKQNNLTNTGFSISKLLDQVDAHNILFPETKYEFVGLTGLEGSKTRTPHIEVILKQTFVDSNTQATPSEIADYMQTQGFTIVNPTTFKKNEYTVSDLHPRNVLKGKNGGIYVVDNIITSTNVAQQKASAFIDNRIKELADLIKAQKIKIEKTLAGLSKGNDMFAATGVDDGSKNKTLFEKSATNTEQENIKRITDPLNAELDRLIAEKENLENNKDKMIAEASAQQDFFNGQSGTDDAQIVINGLNPLPTLMGAINKFQERYIAQNTRKIEDWAAAEMSLWGQSKNYMKRNASHLATSIFNGIPRSKENITGKLLLSGGFNKARFDASKLIQQLYDLVGSDLSKIEQAHEMLDPDLYASLGVSQGPRLGTIPLDVQMLHDELRDLLDSIHRRNFALGFIDQATYDKHKGRYVPRLYETFEIPEDVQKLIDEQEKYHPVTKLDLGQFKGRKELDALSQQAKDDLLKDPVYGAVKRLMQLDQNAAIAGYIKQIMEETPHLVITPKQAVVNSKQPAVKKSVIENKNKDLVRLDADGKEIVKDPTDLELIPPPETGLSVVPAKDEGQDIPLGYQLMSGKGYGKLDGKYVPNYIAEDFKGFFMLNGTMDKFYTAFKAYDRWKPRQFLKKSYTVFNPVVQLGNFISNFAFAFSAGIDPVTFASGIPEAYRNLKNESNEFQTLLRQGILGNDIVSTDLMPLKAKQGMAAKKQPLVIQAWNTFDEVTTKMYGMSDDLSKMNAFLTFKKQGFTEQQAIRKVYEGFQNYATVGKMWDAASKTPLIGNPFLKFTADLFRIMKNGITKTPLTTSMYFYALSSIPSILQLAGVADREDDDEEELRTSRAFIPKVPLGFTDIPLVYKTKFGEVNLARFISPFYLFDTGNDEGVNNLVKKFLPVTLVEKQEAGKGNVSTLINLSDPLLGTAVNALFSDTDFRGKSIKDPEATRFRASGATRQEQIENKLTYLGRSWIPQGAQMHDFYLSQKYGEDFYGRTKNIAQSLMNMVVKVQAWEDGDYKKEATKRLDSDLSRMKSLGDERKNIGANILAKANIASTDFNESRITKKQYDERVKLFKTEATTRLNDNQKQQEKVYKDIEEFVAKYKKFLE